MSYEDRYQLPKWPTLSDRRIYLSLDECYNIVFVFYHLKFEDFFEFATTKCTRINHSYKLYIKPARLNYYKHSFLLVLLSVFLYYFREFLYRVNLITSFS